MDAGSSKLLESAAQRTLHAQNFSRSSSQASHVLTDLLSGYLSLLTTTCGQHAQHAGRSGITVNDAVLALDELGVSMDELSDYYETEGKELTRYTNGTTRRAEELAEIKASLLDGLKQDRDDAIQLIYGRLSSLSPFASDDEDEDGDCSVATDEMDVDESTRGPGSVSTTRFGSDLRRASTPPLPLSPVSNPSSPSRKRARTSSWRPPPHIPDFLPPYPSSSPPPSPTISHPSELPAVHPMKVEKPLTPPPQLSASASTSDYLTPVPYSMSSISTVPEWHLPHPPSPHLQPQQLASLSPQLETNRTLIHAYHHVLTNPPPPNPPANPARHKLGMSLLTQNYLNPRWVPPDTLFSLSNPPPPRIVAPAPSCPIPLKDVSLASQDVSKTDKGKEKRQPLLPPPTPRPVVVTETITSLSNQAMSRIPDIARHILPPAVYHRATKLLPPPPLTRPSNEKLLYGQGIPAPWNPNNSAPPPNVANAKKPKDAPNGKASEKGVDDKPDVLADARLFATWDWEVKDFRMPLAPGRRGRTGGPASALPRSSFNLGIPSVLGASGRQRGIGRSDGKNG